MGNGPEATGGTLTNTAQDIGAIREPGGVSECDALARLEYLLYFLTTGQEPTNDLILPNEWNGLLRRRAHRLHRHHQVLTTCRKSTAIPTPRHDPHRKSMANAIACTASSCVDNLIAEGVIRGGGGRVGIGFTSV